MAFFNRLLARIFHLPVCACVFLGEVGRICQQTFIDTYSRVAFAKLYTQKHAIIAADMLRTYPRTGIELEASPVGS